LGLKYQKKLILWCLFLKFRVVVLLQKCKYIEMQQTAGLEGNGGRVFSQDFLLVGYKASYFYSMLLKLIFIISMML